jgi:hypothetical protein
VDTNATDKVDDRDYRFPPAAPVVETAPELNTTDAPEMPELEPAEDPAPVDEAPPA